MTFKLIICLLILSFFQIHNPGNTYTVNTETLNIREDGNKDSEIIGKLHFGDTIISTGHFNGWIRFDIKKDNGFVHSNYLNLLTKQELSTYTKNNYPFIYNYYEGAKYPFVIIFIILGCRDYIKFKRIRDGRFTKGHREIPFSLSELFKYAFYAFIFSIPFGLVFGIYSLF